MTRKSNVAGYLALMALALVLAGCGNEESEKLFGRWEGQAEGSPNATESENSNSDGGGLSLLSRFDFSIALDFSKDGTVQMSVAGGEDNLPPGSQLIVGQWSVVEAEKNRLTVEIETPPAPASPSPVVGADSKATQVSQTTAANAPGEKRRFVFRWTEGEPDRFSLTEEEGEPHLGSLVFRRAKSEETQPE